MAKISIDGVEYEVNSANNLLQECLSQALDLPYFCWHPSLGSVGACRQCAVKQYRDAQDKVGTLVMACMTPVQEGGLYSIKDVQATRFRANVIESLMISHPHDCPVCEEGGECHLQDMTQMSGHTVRRYDFQKVTHRNQNLGPCINHEMNRCIACYRCVRFYGDYAGGTDLVALGAHHHVYFGRQEEGTLQSEFSGNLVEVCPTGVFTDKPFSAHYTRKWDLQSAPSVCTGCSLGCNITPGERNGTLRRVVNRYHPTLNGYFLCDRGRFGYDANNAGARISHASYAAASASTASGIAARKPLSTAEAQRQLNAMIAGDVIGIGSPRASLESNLALRARVGVHRFYAGMADAELACAREVIAVLREQGLHCPDLRQIEASDCVLLVNEDITNTAARMALSVRQATRQKASALAAQARIPLWQDAAVRELAQHERSPLIILSPQGTRLDDVARETLLLDVQAQISLLQAVAHVLDGKSPAPAKAATGNAAGIAEHLMAAARPCLIGGFSATSPALIRATANVARALRSRREAQGDTTPVQICFVMPEANSLGLALLLEDSPNTLSAALTVLGAREADAAIVLANDLSQRCAPAALSQAMATQTPLIVLDHFHTPFNAGAHLLLPIASPFEENGTYVNYEARAQHSYQVFAPDDARRPAWDWLSSRDGGVQQSVSSQDILAKAAGALPDFAALAHLEPARTGISSLMKSPRQTHRASGRTALHANAHVHESQQRQDKESALAFSMEGVPLQHDASLLSAAWAPGWNSNQAISKFQQEINGALSQGSTGVHLLARTLPPASYAQAEALEAAPAAFYPIFHLFGSEEVSRQAPALAARAVGAYVCVDEDRAQALGVRQHGRVSLEGDTWQAEVPILIRQRIATGSVGVYCADELNPHALEGGFTLRALADGDALARSREMFRHLVINDAKQQEGGK